MRYNEPDNMELGLGFARQSKSARGARRHARVYLPKRMAGAAADFVICVARISMVCCCSSSCTMQQRSSALRYWQ